jgi:glycosyltransferase involved in cell wall biosynthesis
VTKPKKILFLTYYYPPSPAVGALRAEKVVRAFQAAGHQVTVVTARLPEERPGIRLKEPGFTVRAIRSVANPRFWYLALKDRVRGTRSTPAGGGRREDSVKAPARVAGWKRLLGALLWLPDDKQGFILSAALTSLARGRPDLIYTTAPPFSVHLAGLLIKTVTRARWAAEFRDPWTDNPWKPAHVRTGATESVERWLERRVLRSADHLVGVSAGIHQALTGKPGVPAERCLLIRNGIDRLAEQRPPREPGPYRIVHIGSFYHGRDPRPFLSGLAQVTRERGMGPGDLRVDLVGNCRWFSGISVEQEVKRLGLEEFVGFTDWVPHAEAQAIIGRSDLLLLLAQNQPLQVPNKLYEYLGTRIPILGFVDETGESADILREAGGHHVVTSADPARVVQILERALNADRVEPAAGRSDSLENLTTARQMERLLSRVLS